MISAARIEVDRRSGYDRRRRSDPHYRGPERRTGADRRASSSGRVPAFRESLVGTAAKAHPRYAPPVHRLAPINGHAFLSPLVIVMRIAAEFAFIEADESAGYDHVEEIIRQIEARNRRSRDELIAERVAQLQKVKSRAVHVCFGDDPGCELGYLSAVVIPGEPLIFEYESLAHEEAVQPLLYRCAKVLGYGIADGVAGDFAANFLLSLPLRR